jgi:hypothetical protein
MPFVDRARIRRYFQRADSVSTMSQKGTLLEGLVAYLFGRIPGLRVTERNQMTVFNTEEVDVVLWNSRDPNGLSSVEFPAILLVECKNWTNAVGSMELAWFIMKVWGRGQDFGILVAANGITGNAFDLNRSHQLIARALSHGIRIIVITRPEILSITHSDDLVRLLETKLAQLVVHQTSLL